MKDLYYNFSISNFYLPVLIFFGTYFGLLLFKNSVVTRLKKISATTDTMVDDIILDTLGKTKHLFILCAALYAGFQSHYLDALHGKMVDKVFIVIVGIQVIIWGKDIINSWLEYTLKRKTEEDPAARTSLGFIALFLKILFVAGVFLFVLNNLGVNISTFIAGLGVGGIAIALATQNILGDLFSSLSIVMDKPFTVGDFISLGEWAGTVEHVGLKTTRIRSITGEQIVVSNSDLLTSKIRNFKRMYERRIVFQLGVVYQTDRKAFREISKMVEDIIVKAENARFDRAHFIRFGSYSLDFEIVYWVTSPDYKTYADIHEKILFDIDEAFASKGIEFAFPTQTLFVEKNS